MTVMLDPRRFWRVRKCKKLPGSYAFELHYDDGTVERLNGEYFLRCLESINHPDVESVRQRVYPRRTTP
jgi:hypothetical protein